MLGNYHPCVPYKTAIKKVIYIFTEEKTHKKIMCGALELGPASSPLATADYICPALFIC